MFVQIYGIVQAHFDHGQMDSSAAKFPVLRMDTVLLVIFYFSISDAAKYIPCSTFHVPGRIWVESTEQRGALCIVSAQVKQKKRYRTSPNSDYKVI